MKRNLTDKQKRQQQAYSEEQEGQHGLVITNFGQTVLLVDDSSQLIESNIRKHVGAVVTGDNVLFKKEDSISVIVKCLPRDNLLKRPDKYKGEKLIAANIDQVLIVISNDPEPDLYSLDRYLVAMREYNIPIVILFHKQDLAPPILRFSDKSKSLEIKLTLDEVISYYINLGYECIKTSIYNDTKGLSALANILKNKTNILLGLSGAGKSSLLNAVTDSNRAIVGELSSQNKKGKHTTSATTLYPLGPGSKEGFLIDSPGIRRFGLWHIDKDMILTGFIELGKSSANCKFRDCKHDSKAQGCAVQILVKSSCAMAELRLRHYFRIINEIG
jgi:ribosome biogenesis GTPase / thiamine phosphate phosphatase